MRLSVCPSGHTSRPFSFTTRLVMRMEPSNAPLKKGVSKPCSSALTASAGVTSLSNHMGVAHMGASPRTKAQHLPPSRCTG